MSSKVKYIIYYLIVNIKIRAGQADVQVALRRHDGEVNRRRGKRRRKILPRNLCWIRTGTQAHGEPIGGCDAQGHHPRVWPFRVPPSCPGLHATCSKLELEGELDRPRPANLVERVETTIGPTGPQAARECLRRVAEQGAGEVVIGIAEVWGTTSSIGFIPRLPDYSRSVPTRPVKTAQVNAPGGRQDRGGTR